MLMQIGPIQFDLIFNAQEVIEDKSADFADKPVIGILPPKEFMGPGEETLGIEGTIFPEKLGGLGSLGALQALMRSGVPQMVVRGDGAVLGWHVIRNVSDKHDYLNAKGVGRKIGIRVTLAKAQGPSAAAAFANLFGILS